MCRLVVGAGGVEARGRPDDARWYGTDSPVIVQGVLITGGMLYIGRFLPACPGAGASSTVLAPCLIDPSLAAAVDTLPAGIVGCSSPTYAGLSPGHRRQYLKWLASDRADPRSNLDWVRLYFYGIERRLIASTPSLGEEESLIAEIIRLRNTFAARLPLHGPVQTLLGFISMRKILDRPDGLATWKPTLSTHDRRDQLTLRLKVGLMVLAKEPLDFELAMATILMIEPYSHLMFPGSSLDRVRNEFIELVRWRFSVAFPLGYILRDHRGSTLQLKYRAASRYLAAKVEVSGVERVPDPFTLSWVRLLGILDQATSDLAPYARHIGKGRARSDNVEAALLLPPEIADRSAVAPFRRWLSEQEQPIAEVSLEEVANWCVGNGSDPASIKNLRVISSVLARVGYGMEPDPGHGGIKPNQAVLLFRLGASAAVECSSAFEQADFVAAALARGTKPSGGSSRLAATLSHLCGLSDDESLRLMTRLLMTGVRPVTPARAKAAIGELPTGQRATLAGIATTAAATCGMTEPQDIAALEYFYDLLGIERGLLYASLHNARNGGKGSDAPMVVEQASSGSKGFRIRAEPMPETVGQGLVIDMARVAAISLETREVAQVLAPIYDEDENTEVFLLAAKTGSRDEDMTAPPLDVVGVRFPHLRADHAALLEALSLRPSWSRDEFDAMARLSGLMADGAIETINEWSYDEFGTELIEDGDPITLNTAVLPPPTGETS